MNVKGSIHSNQCFKDFQRLCIELKVQLFLIYAPNNDYRFKVIEVDSYSFNQLLERTMNWPMSIVEATY